MQQAWWWKWLVETMTGGGGGEGGGGGGQRGAEGGCVSEEKPCPISFKTPLLVEIAGKPSESEETAPPLTPTPKSTVSEVDFFTQARKALCLRSPFDGDDASNQTPTSSSTTVPSTAFLPSRLAQLLSKQSDSRKRHKRSHSGGNHKGRPEKSRGSNIWVETEEYFRELTVEDIDMLNEASSLRFSSNIKCLTLPALENVGSACNLCSVGNSGTVKNNGVSHGEVGMEDEGCKVKEEGKGKGGRGEEGEMKENELEFMDVDIVVGVNEVVCTQEDQEKEEKRAKEEKTVKVDKTFNGFEWLLGSRSKIYLTSERPSKKRKLLGGDAGLEKLHVAHPVEVLSSLCHYCSVGDMGDQLNRLIVCSSCGVAVHQRCYGVQNDVDGSWLCSWCKQRKDGQNGDKPCLLCAKQGGALKPAQKKENLGGLVEFAHLFCCQWMPEVYVENIRTMEPIMNTDGIKDTRRKLICYLCKVKCGACVRCSNGACRTSFHPLCAREARHRMEIWGRLGCDEVELRAFCSKHSEVENRTSDQCTGDNLVPVGSDSKNQVVTPTANKIHKLKIGRRNGDKMTVNVETDDLTVDADRLKDSVLHVDGLPDNRTSSKIRSEFVDLQHVNKDTVEMDTTEDANASDTLNFKVMLKKLIDQGKVDLKDLAEEFGASPDSLASVLTDNHVVCDLNGKIVTWLNDHGYLGSLQKALKGNIKSGTSSKTEAHIGVPVDITAVTVDGTDITDIVPVKFVPPRRRTKSDTRILKNEKVICTAEEMIGDDMVMDEIESSLPNGEGRPRKEASDGIEKNLDKTWEFQDIPATNPPEAEVEPSKAVGICLSEDVPPKADVVFEQRPFVNSDIQNANSSVVLDQVPDLIKSESSYVHPLVQRKLIEMDNGLEYEGLRERGFSQLGASSSSGICCQRHSQQSTDWISKLNGANLEQLVKARNMGQPELSGSDEVEGELIFCQHRLLCISARRKSLIDDLVSKVAKNLQEEIDAARKQKWDAVLLSQYLYELREAKKQGRKERRHKEAQAVLAAATAAAAASSRISSLRKDATEESVRVEDLSKGGFSNGRSGFYPQQNPRFKETLSRSAAARLSSENNSDPFPLALDFSVEHPRTCEICGRCETILNPILVCSSCKVAVHLDCYRGVKSSTGPWYCELCEDLLLSRGSGVTTTTSWEKPYFVAECGLCGGTAGAFRKSSDSQWIHAFCAEWVLESTFRRGQVNPIDGMETVSKGCDVCVICSRKQGACIKCNYGNCQSTFHASCARSTGFYMNMNIRTSGGKIQRKAYCAKHSLDQKAKAETQKHGIEEFKSLKKVRMELERLRLLCDRIIKREKLKRELVLCSHDILASDRDTAVLSALTRHPLYHPDVSSESVTTSTRCYTDGNKSGSDMIQRSDDVTVDSTVAGKRHVKFPMPMDNDQKTDDSSVSQHFVTQKPIERVSFSGKQVPNRPAVGSRNLSEDAEKRPRYRKHPETFEKELVMTSDQASMRNQRLPKGFVYVPIRRLSKDKETLPDACSQEPFELDG